MGLFESRVPQNLMVSNFVLPLKQQFWGTLSMLVLNFRTDLFINEQLFVPGEKTCDDSVPLSNSLHGL